MNNIALTLMVPNKGRPSHPTSSHSPSRRAGSNRALFDHLVGAGEKGEGNFESERFRTPGSRERLDLRDLNVFGPGLGVLEEQRLQHLRIARERIAAQIS